jgi:hypothetical protein
MRNLGTATGLPKMATTKRCQQGNIGGEKSAECWPSVCSGVAGYWAPTLVAQNVTEKLECCLADSDGGVRIRLRLSLIRVIRLGPMMIFGGCGGWHKRKMCLMYASCACVCAYHVSTHPRPATSGSYQDVSLKKTPCLAPSPYV